MGEQFANDPTDAGPTLNGAISTTPPPGTSETWTLSDTGTRTVTDGVTNSSTTITSATAAFTDADLNGAISGTGIPAGARITARASGTSVTISSAATATASGVSLTILRNGPLPQRFPYRARADDSASVGDATVELVKVTAHPSSTTATVVRGAGGTVPKAHANGAKFRHVWTAGSLGRAISGAQDALKRAGAIAETFSRAGATTGNVAGMLSGRLFLCALQLPANEPITSITFMSGGTALSGGTHQWFGLFDDALNALAFTSDDTSASWNSSTEKTLALSSPFITTYSGLYYIGVMVTATTVPNLMGVASGGSANTGLAPILTGTSTTGQTGVPALPFTAAALAAVAGIPWAYVS